MANLTDFEKCISIDEPMAEEGEMVWIATFWNDDAYRVIYPDLDKLDENSWINVYVFVSDTKFVSLMPILNKPEGDYVLEYTLSKEERKMFLELAKDWCRQKGIPFDDFLKEAIYE